MGTLEHRLQGSTDYFGIKGMTADPTQGGHEPDHAQEQKVISRG